MIGQKNAKTFPKNILEILRQYNLDCVGKRGREYFAVLLLYETGFVGNFLLKLEV